MKTFILMLCTFCTASLLHAQTIKQVEYFIDKDKGVGKNTKLNLAASADSGYQFNIDISDISQGYHKLYVRTKDSKGKWSSTTMKDIEVTAFLAQPEIIKGEYFFDKDPGYGKAKQITIASQDTAVIKNFVAGTAGLSIGFHKLYTRFKDNSGHWSFTLLENIEMIKAEEATKIVAAEYFFTSDNGFGKATPIKFATTSSDSTFKFKVAYNKIPAKADTLFIRVEDSLGNWSITKIVSFNVKSLLKDTITDDIKTNADNSLNQIHVFPNPASQTININFQSKNKSASLQIFDVNGRPVLRTAVTPGVSNSIDISKFASGSYFIQISDGEVMRSAKFIKR